MTALLKIVASNTRHLPSSYHDLVGKMYKRGWDTLDIAVYLGVSEAEVYNTLAILRD
jgi:hypothetical protein